MSYLLPHASKLWLAAFTLPGALLLIGVDVLAESRHVLRTYQAQMERGGAPQPGDIVVVSGLLQATPVVLPDRFPAFRNALMVTKQHEERHWEIRRWRWRETRRLTWKSDVRSIAEWQLDDSVIEHGEFDRFRASPCTDYQPPAGWTADCIFGDYAKRVDDSSRRFSYIVTPIPDAPITLIAVASRAPGTLAAFMRAHRDPVAIVARGEWSESELLQHRVNRMLLGMGILIAIVFLVACWFSYTIRRRLRYLGKDRGFVGDLCRAALVSAPYMVAFWPLAYEETMWAVLIAAFVSSAFISYIWLEGRRARRRGW